MKLLRNTFISSTFWTERIGSVAALKSLEVMEATALGKLSLIREIELDKCGKIWLMKIL